MTAPDPALHPSTFIDDLLTSHKWSRDYLAAIMDGSPETNRKLLDYYADHGPTDPRCRLGITAANLSDAFGLPITFFIRLEALWLASAKP